MSESTVRVQAQVRAHPDSLPHPQMKWRTREVVIDRDDFLLASVWSESLRADVQMVYGRHRVLPKRVTVVGSAGGKNADVQSRR
jgi:hypothetical protein